MGCALNDAKEHTPVMLAEIMEALQPAAGKILLDGTVGYGGHTHEWLRRSEPDGIVIGLDQDPEALQYSRKLLEPVGTRCTLLQANFEQFDLALTANNIAAVDAMLLDLGVSSPQLQVGPRGFSFQQEGPLDMRMNPESALTAAEIVNKWPEPKLADLFHEYGEERYARRIARMIVQERRQNRIETTQHLAQLIKSRVRSASRRIHPATRVFQALRIAVNNELGALDHFLDKFQSYLRPRGRVAILSYHSLEDRRVKLAFRKAAADQLRILTKKPLTPSDEEIHDNPRARSAKLRVGEKTQEA